MPKLHITLPDGTETSHELLDDVITVGRLPDNTIQIDDASVSSHHAQLSLIGGEYELKDLNSTNGTYVNGQRISGSHLKPGDAIRFGKIDTAFLAELAAGDDARPLPEAENLEVKLAEASQRPADFGSFKKKTKAKRDPVGKMILAFSVLAILAFVGAMVSIFLIEAPALP
jgi:pSer/pThr/pTyr-binding forkhead associated (FHA) protein